MACDLPQTYEKFMDAFRFIKDVALDWDRSVYLEAEPAQYVTVARKAKGSDNWFIGATAGENGHYSRITLDFLDPGREYTATIYRDAPDADYKTNPQSYVIETMRVDSGTELSLKIAPAGGYAVSIFPVTF